MPSTRRRFRILVHIVISKEGGPGQVQGTANALAHVITQVPGQGHER